jgi:hypothetical protein
MGAIVKACSVNVTVGNTGKECDTAMGATAMLIALHGSVKFNDTDLLNPVPWMNSLIHQRLAFPLFGQQAPIRTITNNAESDVLVTLDDGLQVFLRYGVYNRIFETTSGGFCYARSLSSFNKSGYRILELDQTGQMLARLNATDKTYSGFITDFMYAPSPIWADFKNTPYKNRFQISYSPTEVVNNGIIFSGAEELLSMMGLIDTDIVLVSATTTAIKVKVLTECAGTDLVKLYGAKFASPTMFIVTSDTGANVTVTVTVNSTTGEVTLTGSFISGKTYYVKGAIPTVWQTALVEGYDAYTDGILTVVIP